MNPNSSGKSYTQISFPLTENKPPIINELLDQNALSITLPGISSSSLGFLDTYDSELIRRVLVKDLGPIGSEVRVFLKEQILASVSVLSEPKRVSLELHQEGYSEPRNAKTGLPMVLSSSTTPSQNRPNSPAYPMPNHLPTPKSTEPYSSAKGEGSSELKLLRPPLENKYAADPMLDYSKINKGRGPAWKNYPLYIYRIQTAAFEHQSKPKAGQQVKKSLMARSSSEATAKHASELYNFGHENQALAAYSQVLRANPSVFDEDVLHLWKLAEIHLGQGNLALAEGYYQAIIERHPNLELSNFAKLRKLDLISINQSEPVNYQKLLDDLEQIPEKNIPELVALKSIRYAYWSTPKALDRKDSDTLPVYGDGMTPSLEKALNGVYSNKTAFVGSAVLLNSYINSTQPWNKTTSAFATDFFKRFSGPGVEPYRSNLLASLKSRIATDLNNLSSNGKYIETITTYESIEIILKNLAKSPDTAWSIAEAYRNLGQIKTAIPFYQDVSQRTQNKTRRAKATFWLAMLSAQISNTEVTNQRERSRYQALSQQADERLYPYWQELSETNQQRLSSAYAKHLNEASIGNELLKSPPKIVLANWTKRLATNDSIKADDTSNWKTVFNPNTRTINFFSKLADRFTQLGLPSERRKTLELLRNLSPQLFQGQNDAQKQWAEQLLTLAEEYRGSNNFLEAGRIYTFTAKNTQSWQGRAEALYKGGLLLYRAGRRQEAVEAFELASEDGENLFYASLASERLEQLAR